MPTLTKQTPPAPRIHTEYTIPAFTYEVQDGLVPRLVTAIHRCGGWVVDRRTVSGASVELLVEVQLRGVLELYGALAATGVELARTGGQTLTALCTRRRHSRMRVVGEVLRLRLTLRFMEEDGIAGLLACGSLMV